MNLVNQNTRKGYRIEPHGNNKRPNYFDAAEKSRTVTINGVETKMVMHPANETSRRVNFQIPDPENKNKVLNLFVDKQGLWETIMADDRTPLVFVTVEAMSLLPKDDVRNKVWQTTGLERCFKAAHPSTRPTNIQCDNNGAKIRRALQAL